MIKQLYSTIVFFLVLTLSSILNGYSQSASDYEKTAVFSGYTPDKGQLIFYFIVRGERASSASITTIPQGNFDKSKEFNLYLLGTGSTFPKWKGLKMSMVPPRTMKSQETIYVMADDTIDRLYLSDQAGHIIAVLDWQYEGPVDGRGTACTSCLEKQEAFQAFRKYFLTNN